MKGASFLVLLVFSVMLAAYALALIKPAVAEDAVVVGKWDRTDGADKYTIYANRTTQTVLPGGTYYGTWDYDGPGGYKYIFHWEHSPPGQAPFIDYVTVAADGQSYSGINNYGNNFHCVRIGDASASESGGFPIVPVAIGGGVAAAAVVGAAVYWFFFAGKTAAESAEATAGSLAVNEKTKEVALFDRVTRPLSKIGKTIDNDMRTSQHPDKGVDDIQQRNRQVEQPELKKLLEKVQEQTKTKEIQNQQNIIPNEINETIKKMPQELKMKSKETQEVADSGESDSNANA